jgi:hypothetical protein
MNSQGLNLENAPQRHRDTEKIKLLISYHANSVHLFGESADRRNNLFFLRVSVSLWFNCFF